MKPTKPTTHILDLREARERYEKRCKDKNSCDYQEGVGDGMDIVLEMLRNEGK
jgi:hypothetical protein